MTAYGTVRGIQRMDTAAIDRLRAIVEERKARHAETVILVLDAMEALREAEDGRQNATELLKAIEAADHGPRKTP